MKRRASTRVSHSCAESTVPLVKFTVRGIVCQDCCHVLHLHPLVAYIVILLVILPSF